MSEFLPKHLVLVRHGESEGDVRRAMANQPLSNKLNKHPRDEAQTKFGHEQSAIAGRWIAKFILQMYQLKSFDWQFVSPLLRTKQSADSMNLNNDWQIDYRLSERDRGLVQGMTKREHQKQFPKSYQQMLDHPFYWKPPEGESLLKVATRFNSLVDDFISSEIISAVLMTHRDVLWASLLPIDGLDIDEVENVNTDTLLNGHVLHYTNINPMTNNLESSNLVWKRSCTPWKSQPKPTWTKINT